MNMKNIFYCLLPGLLLGACSNKVYEKTGDSVIVKVQHKETGGPRLVRLQVMGDKLIHKRNRNFRIILEQFFVLTLIIKFIRLMLA